uniref:Uncharacterized protein n=1 Tax=Lepeophtheirus salmonis TaxID=72036 RepID=A0A0K2V266_LEPSM
MTGSSVLSENKVVPKLFSDPRVDSPYAGLEAKDHSGGE